MVILFGQETYIHFVAQETTIIRKLLFFNRDIPKCPTFLFYYTVHDLKLSDFFPKKTAKKCDNLGTFTQKILFLDYSKPKKAKSVTI